MILASNGLESFKEQQDVSKGTSIGTKLKWKAAIALPSKTCYENMHKEQFHAIHDKYGNEQYVSLTMSLYNFPTSNACLSSLVLRSYIHGRGSCESPNRDKCIYASVPMKEDNRIN